MGCLVKRTPLDDILLLQISSGLVWQFIMDLQLSRSISRLCFFIVLSRDLFVSRDDSLKAIMQTEQPIKCFEPL